MLENEDKGVRLNKAISDTGFCSRREADKLIEQGKVTINGRKGVLGDKVTPMDIIKVNNKLLSQPQKTIYIAFNKPRGIFFYIVFFYIDFVYINIHLYYLIIVLMALNLLLQLDLSDIYLNFWLRFVKDRHD